MLELLQDLWGFMKERKKFWLFPIILFMLLLGLLIIGGQGSAYIGFRVLRGSTVVTQGTNGTGNMINSSFSDYIGSSNITTQAAFNFLDSPNTTSATTYKLQMASTYDSYYAYLNRTANNINAAYTHNGTSTITLMEVAA